MAFWLLGRKETEWQTYRGMVIRAPSEDDARKMACELEAGDADSIGMPLEWLDAAETLCAEVPIEGEANIILADFKDE